MTSDYNHDVFISYKRQTHWTPWARDKFCAHLRAYLQQDLGRSPRIFMDEQMLPGRDLPRDLGKNLASSKVVVPLLSRDYFGSDWCIHELDLIYERNAQFLLSGGGTQNIIIPIVVHDGELIPSCIRSILYDDFSNFRRTVIAPDSPLAESFSEAVMKVSIAISAAINHAPPFDPMWVDHHKKRFVDLQAAAPGSGTVRTVHFTVNPTGMPTSTPRPMIGTP